jgi:hypothetical protein
MLAEIADKEFGWCLASSQHPSPLFIGYFSFREPSPTPGPFGVTVPTIAIPCRFCVEIAKENQRSGRSLLCFA